MKRWKPWGMGLVVLASLSPAAGAQTTPAVPSTGTATQAATTAASSGTGGARNIWSFFCMTPEQKAECKRKFCASQFGQFMNNSLLPASAFTGGIIGPCCPEVTNEQLRKPADSAEGAAARVKEDEKNAKARRAAIRYLGTVDCNYWPEAQAALINGLRADRNECVRYEAAMVLGSGCCCTKKTIEALSLTVSGSDKDGNPAESCERVKAAAFVSLQHCLICAEQAMIEAPPERPRDEPKPDKPTPGPFPLNDRKPDKLPRNPAAYYRDIERLPMDQVIQNARRAMTNVELPASGVPAVRNSGPGLFQIIGNALPEGFLDVNRPTSLPGQAAPAAPSPGVMILQPTPSQVKPAASPPPAVSPPTISLQRDWPKAAPVTTAGVSKPVKGPSILAPAPVIPASHQAPANHWYPRSSSSSY